MKNIVLSFIMLACAQFAAAQDFRPDTSVSGISLLNAMSVSQALPEIRDPWQGLHEDSQERMKVVIMNTDKTQMLEMFFLEGSDKNEFGEFRISEVLGSDAAATPEKALIAENIPGFVTARGIKLGVSSSYLKEKLGYKFKEENVNGNVLLSFTKDIKGTACFVRYNMPAYFADYYFVDDKLVKFSFGFLAP
jgi:hypothetical protein